MTTVRRIEDVDAAAEKGTWGEGDFTLESPEDDEAAGETTAETQLSARVATNTGR